MTMTKNKGGRKPGSKQVDRVVSIVKPSHCPKCGCTDRTPYRGIVKQQKIDQVIDGVRYNLIEWKPTKCLNPSCKQSRMDRVYRNTTAKSN